VPAIPDAIEDIEILPRVWDISGRGRWRQRSQSLVTPPSAGPRGMGPQGPGSSTHQVQNCWRISGYIQIV